jgi:hypothetical protein
VDLPQTIHIVCGLRQEIKALGKVPVMGKQDQRLAKNRTEYELLPGLVDRPTDAEARQAH